MGSKNSGRRAPVAKPSPNQSSFGIWLTSYLSKHNLSIMDLSNKTGVTDPAIRDWIKGTNFPKYDALLEVVEVIAIEEVCFIDTIMMEAIQTHPNYLLAKRREIKRHETVSTEGIGV